MIEKEAYSRPWTEQQFLQELDSDHSWLELLEWDGVLAGYICFWIVAKELQVLNVATAPIFRRKGVARRLLEQAFAQADILDTESAFLEVRSGNRGAISLYRDFGFAGDGVRRGYYSDGEDALLMSCSLKSFSNDGVRA